MRYGKLISGKGEFRGCKKLLIENNKLTKEIEEIISKSKGIEFDYNSSGSRIAYVLFRDPQSSGAIIDRMIKNYTPGIVKKVSGSDVFSRGERNFIYTHVEPGRVPDFPHGLILTDFMVDDREKQLGEYFPNYRDVPVMRLVYRKSTNFLRRTFDTFNIKIRKKPLAIYDKKGLLYEI